ncbi:hypothetical protein CBS101457_006491 [Exobasidium rhododendri]|nr:hypothetical protein CBS101457_006491 [Exobasidium rhododendri]
MQFALALILALTLAVLQPVLSTAVLTAPVASTTTIGGSSLKLKWSDNGVAPELSSAWGGVNIFLAAGGESTQYKLQQLASNISTKTTHGSYIVDQSIGPDGQYYFIRMEGTETNSSGIPAMSFSARFTLTGMTGTFNSTVLAAAESKEGTSTSSSTAATSAKSTATSLSKSVSASSSSAAVPTTTSTNGTSSSSQNTSTSSAGKTQQAIIFVGGAAAAAAGFVALM